MIVRKEKKRYNISVRMKDGRILRGVKSVKKNNTYEKYIGIIPIVYNKSRKKASNSSKIGVFNFNMFLSRSKRFPIIPYIEREDMDKHIRIYARRKYNIMKSDFVDIQYLGTNRGMSIYILLIQYNKKIASNERGYNYSWNNYCIMYDKGKDIDSIYSWILSENKLFLDNIISPGEIEAPDIQLSFRDIIKVLELRDTSVHIKE
tara:strand:+ start:1022 stop:1633 length:612 start_codon:yes stop_codon:yes gene_type:complete